MKRDRLDRSANRLSGVAQAEARARRAMRGYSRPVRTSHLVTLALCLALSSTVALAGPPSAVDELVTSAKALSTQNDALAAALKKHEDAAKSKAALEARLVSLRKELGATSDGKRRVALQHQVGAAERELGSLTEVLLAYQKLLAKEAREDRRLRQETAELRDKARRARLQVDYLAAKAREADEKADAAMRAAEAQLALGVVSSALQVAAAAGALVDGGAR